VLTVGRGEEVDDPDVDPHTRPVFGNGWVGTSSQERITYQRVPSRLAETVFTVPRTGRCRWTRTCPTPWKRTR